MPQFLTHTTLIVRDYDEAIAWFTGVLGFTLLLARAATSEQEAFIGNQAGGRAFLFLRTDDFARDYEGMRAKGVRFVREPATHAYGTVAVFADLYGNLGTSCSSPSHLSRPD